MAEPAQLNVHVSEKENVKDLSIRPTQDLHTKATGSEHGSHGSRGSISDSGPEKAPQPDGPPPAIDPNAEPEFPSMRKVLVIMAALYMSFFLVALVHPPPSPLTFARPILTMHALPG